MEVLNSELLPAYLGGKMPRLDVKVTFNDGEVADLEMQLNNSSDDLKRRSSQYTALLQAGQAKRGKYYKEIKRVYQIFFINDNLFPESSKFPRRYGYREEKEHDLLTNVTEIIFYELPKLEQLVKEYFADKTGTSQRSFQCTETLSAEEKWCIFLKYRHDQQAKQIIEELCIKEEGIMHAEKQVSKISRSYLKYLKEMDDIKDEWDRQDRQEAARRKGHAEGHAEGLEAGKLEIARNFSKMGIPIEQISEGTGLSMEEIEKL